MDELLNAAPALTVPEGRLEDACSSVFLVKPVKLPVSAVMLARVIDVGSSGGSQAPFLVKTKQDIGAYVTLSYC